MSSLSPRSLAACAGLWLALWHGAFVAGRSEAQTPRQAPSLEPEEYVYSTPGGRELKAYVVEPERAPGRPAVIIAHGGGWTIGSPEWGLGRAATFSALGMVAIAIEYRLTDAETGVTPIEAMADARAAVRWARSHAEELSIAPDRIAGYGWSAGAHLLASAAVFHDADQGEEVSCVPDALILSSPAVSLHHDAWMRRILGDRAEPADISPDVHVRPGMPPTLLLQGRTDTVTPLAGTERFHEAMLAAGNDSRLIVYDGVGHLFTPSTEPDDGWPNPDPEVRAAALEAAGEFLRSLGWVE